MLLPSSSVVFAEESEQLGFLPDSALDFWTQRALPFVAYHQHSHPAAYHQPQHPAAWHPRVSVALLHWAVGVASVRLCWGGDSSFLHSLEMLSFFFFFSFL